MIFVLPAAPPAPIVAPVHSQPCITLVSKRQNHAAPASLSALPFGSHHSTPLEQKPTWQLLVEQLPAKDAETEWYNLREIAPLLGITPHALSKHARDLWPDWQGQYRLNFSQAVSLIRRVCFAGKKVPSRAALLNKVQKEVSRQS